MKIQAVNPVMPVQSCQPIKPDFTGKKLKKVNKPTDNFTPSNSAVSEQKYNLACRIAAFYKAQFEKLLHGEKCLA